MAVELNHTIVASRDSASAASDLAEMLGLPAPTGFGHFQVVQVANGVSLDFASTDREIHPQHYAFLISEDEFDQVYGRIKERNLPHWADPRQTRPDEINTKDGGRGVYWLSPDGHILELITRPYGSGG
ncbi:MAG TPA: VOC family protein [Pseudonocardia sp.]|jgi:hypothetical protein